MQFNLIVKHSDEPDYSAWKELYDRPNVTNKEGAEEYGKELIEFFNSTLGPKEKSREFVGIEILSDDTLIHSWDKTNAVTILKNGSMYDTYKCSICGITGKRFGLNSNITIDYKYRGHKICKVE
jgi:hypothetical protein